MEISQKFGLQSWIPEFLVSHPPFWFPDEHSLKFAAVISASSKLTKQRCIYSHRQFMSIDSRWPSLSLFTNKSLSPPLFPVTSFDNHGWTNIKISTSFHTALVALERCQSELKNSNVPLSYFIKTRGCTFFSTPTTVWGLTFLRACLKIGNCGNVIVIYVCIVYLCMSVCVYLMKSAGCAVAKPLVAELLFLAPLKGQFL